MEEVVNLLSYTFLDEIVETAERTEIIVLDYSTNCNKCGEISFNMDFVVCRKRLQRIQIISNLLCYGSCPEPEDAIEQLKDLMTSLLSYDDTATVLVVGNYSPAR